MRPCCGRSASLPRRASVPSAPAVRSANRSSGGWIISIWLRNEAKPRLSFDQSKARVGEDEVPRVPEVEGAPRVGEDDLAGRRAEDPGVVRAEEGRSRLVEPQVVVQLEHADRQRVVEPVGRAVAGPERVAFPRHQLPLPSRRARRSMASGCQSGMRWMRKGPAPGSWRSASAMICKCAGHCARIPTGGPSRRAARVGRAEIDRQDDQGRDRRRARPPVCPEHQHQRDPQRKVPVPQPGPDRASALKDGPGRRSRAFRPRRVSSSAIHGCAINAIAPIATVTASNPRVIRAARCA